MEQTKLQNSISTKNPSERVKDVINKLKALPDNFKDFETLTSI